MSFLQSAADRGNATAARCVNDVERSRVIDSSQSREAALHGQIAATRKIVALEERRLTPLNRQLAPGAVAGTDILSQQTALAQARQILRALESWLARAAEAASKKYLDKIRSQLNYGGVSQLAVVDAERAYLSASNGRIEAEAQRLGNTVALFVALGG